MEFYEFTEDDLRCNQEGKLSELQLQNLKIKIQEQRNLIGFCVVVLILLVVGFIIFPENFNIFIFYAGSFFLIFGFIFGLWKWNVFANDLLKREIQIFEGYTKVSYGYKPEGYYIILASKKMFIFGSSCPFIDGQIYRIYALSYTGKILSVERLLENPFIRKSTQQNP